MSEPRHNSGLDALGVLDRRQRVPAILAFDPRSYHQHCGQFVYADRVYLGSRWTPFVWMRVRRPRASDGATEI